MKTILLGLVIGLTLFSCSVGVDTRTTTAASPRVLIPFTPDVSINEIMVAQIDHAAHAIWNAANPENSANDVDWVEVEHHAIQLLSSRSAMTMGGTGVNDAMWIAQSTWREYTTQMNDASLQILVAAKAQSMRNLEAAGDYLVDTCEGCHRQYKPSIPTEGVMHPH